MEPIKILITDDSSLSQEILKDIFLKDSEIEVVGTASNGKETIELAKRLRPDLITMDIKMPVMDGFEAIEHIMAYQPTPILVITASPVKGGMDQTFKALELGALDLVAKPVAKSGTGLSKEARKLIERIKLLSKIKVVSHVRGKRKDRAQLPAKKAAGIQEFKVLAVASSTGGPRVLLHILRELPEDFPAGIIVVQHISEGFSNGLAEWLNAECKISVKEAERGDKVRPGLALISPTEYHLVVGDNNFIRLTDDPPFMGHKPSGTILLKSVAEVYGPRSIGLILTGMGKDGASGIKAIKEAGGETIAQDEKTSVVFGMPQAAINLDAVDKILPEDKIPEEIMRLV